MAIIEKEIAKPAGKGLGLRVPNKSELLAGVIDFVTPKKTLDTLLSLSHYEEAEGYAAGVRHYLSKGYWPVGVFVHFVHFDGVIEMKAANRLIEISRELDDPSKHLQGCYGLHQGTMESGDQGEELQILSVKLTGPAIDLGFVPLPYITEEHVKRYNLDPEKVEELNQESTDKMNEAPKKRMALLTFPAGNMRSARRNKTGELNGMVQSDLTWISQMIMYSRSGVPVVFLPGVIKDSFRISDPNTRTLTLEAGLSALRNFLVRSVPGLADSPLEAKLASLTMLPPYPIDKLAMDLAQITGSNVNTQNLRSIARAMFANKELADQLIMGIINDELLDYSKGNYYRGYRSFGLGNHAAALY
ncbi:hypothetical protein A3J19_04315 [Candidatus Daviesbacteria bacterium RIFCSPLOWO2_02_FULL_41_8]|uniref:Uncharacterized protein n=2 Tax=Candidatus Daviesiibacteriota TaxID=1752718 RepID=A0A1F5NJH5_9BACT|nr:MAG: hypothetical protein A2871_00435 [Candidatus Daviesbacteria bacterium RIFCSPHIGHO2_01_FULL_41_23]OGE62364.1 MAG: hypothetical protein A2967_00925 [Candidatus Daviesbacteria bacterium RIFCSPLOWO2_01_FULL_41_32]OGE77713.1 MAG: hypothetical protein A3J19_04315 [Candidatus Daviesbacteria bacterium RIFCSPLOWO2_02_FULL_41_8]